MKLIVASLALLCVISATFAAPSPYENGAAQHNGPRGRKNSGVGIGFRAKRSAELGMSNMLDNFKSSIETISKEHINKMEKTVTDVGGHGSGGMKGINSMLDGFSGIGNGFGSGGSKEVISSDISETDTSDEKVSIATGETK